MILGPMMMNGIFYPIYSRMNPTYTLLEKTNRLKSMMMRRKKPKEVINSIPAMMMAILWYLISPYILKIIAVRITAIYVAKSVIIITTGHLYLVGITSANNV